MSLLEALYHQGALGISVNNQTLTEKSTSSLGEAAKELPLAQYGTHQA